MSPSDFKNIGSDSIIFILFLWPKHFWRRQRIEEYMIRTLTNKGIFAVVFFKQQSCRGMTHVSDSLHLSHLTVKKARILDLSLSWITRNMKYYRQIQQGTVKSNRHTFLESWKVFKLDFFYLYMFLKSRKYIYILFTAQ